ncbi:MAG: S-methyl-5-thioribose-1-phosphate isomerase [Bacteroidota bacterium]
MKINHQHFQSIWLHPKDPTLVQIIDQRFLPHQLVFEDLKTHQDAARAIREMQVRGAPLIGATAAYGMYLACLESRNASDALSFLNQAAQNLLATRPTAVNLSWAIAQQMEGLKGQVGSEERIQFSLKKAQAIAREDAENCRQIGLHGLPIIRAISQQKQGAPVHILTHCNAGWLACVDYGTATAPMYAAHDAGIDLHIWVDETRPRNQGARLTAWELKQHGIPHTIIPDNTGGHLMQHGMVDLVLVGSDRTTRSGDVANKIGTYLKALAAKDNHVPFYVALPASSFDWSISDGLREIPIEQRNSEEVTHIQGWHETAIKKVRLSPEGSPAANYGFDVTPAHLVSGLITERGLCAANETAIAQMFPEHRSI